MPFQPNIVKQTLLSKMKKPRIYCKYKAFKRMVWCPGLDSYVADYQ